MDAHGEFETLEALDVGGVELGGNEHGDGGGLAAALGLNAEEPPVRRAPVVETLADDAFQVVGISTERVGVVQILAQAELSTGADSAVRTPVQQRIATNNEDGKEGEDAQEMSGVEGCFCAAGHGYVKRMKAEG